MEIQEEYEVYDRNNPDIYLTNQCQIEVQRLDSFNQVDSNVVEVEDGTTRKNVLGQSVPKRRSDHTYVNEEEDQDGYTLARSSISDTARRNPTRTNGIKNRIKSLKHIDKLEKSHKIMAGILIVFFVAGITAVILKFSLSPSNNNRSN